MSKYVNALESSPRTDEIIRRAQEQGGERIYPGADVYVTNTGEVVAKGDPKATYLVCAAQASIPKHLADDLGVTGDSAPANNPVQRDPLPPVSVETTAPKKVAKSSAAATSAATAPTGGLTIDADPNRPSDAKPAVSVNGI